MKSPGADFHVVRLQNDASLLSPILIEREYDLLKIQKAIQEKISKLGVAHILRDCPSMPSADFTATWLHLIKMT